MLRTTPEQNTAIDVLAAEGKEALSTEALKDIEDLEAGADDPEAFKLLEQAWEDEGNKGMAAIYAYQAAQLSNTPQAWKNAGDKLSKAYTIARDRNMSQGLVYYFITGAAESYESAIALDPKDLESKAALAAVYTDGQGEVMRGVQLLRQILEEDPDNVAANLTLGRFSIMSGQYDKAVLRLETVLRNEPDNLETLIYIADAYRSLGEDAKAEEALVKAAEVATDEELRNEINNRLEEIKK